jgi:polar amino acid transport system substrate-binding protein
MITGIKNLIHFQSMFYKSALFLLFLFIPSSLVAQNKIIIGVEDIQYLPYYQSEKGVFSGFARDLFDAFARENNLEVIYRPMSIRRLHKALVEEKIDLKFPDNPNWNSAVKQGVNIEYSASVVAYTDGVMVKALGNEIKRLGTIKGFTPWAWLDQIKQKQVALYENPNFTGLLQQVFLDRLDGAYINVDVARYTLKNILKREGELQFDNSLPYDKGRYYASTRSNPELVVRLNSWLKEQKQEVDKLKKHWQIE